MRLNNWSIAASYDTARIFAGLGFGSSTASRSIISRPRRTGLCSGGMAGVGALLGIDPAFQAARHRRYVGCPHAVLLFGRNPLIGHCPVL
jgi:hypothetical protein